MRRLAYCGAGIAIVTLWATDVRAQIAIPTRRPATATPAARAFLPATLRRPGESERCRNILPNGDFEGTGGWGGSGNVRERGRFDVLSPRGGRRMLYLSPGSSYTAASSDPVTFPQGPIESIVIAMWGVGFSLDPVPSSDILSVTLRNPDDPGSAASVIILDVSNNTDIVSGFTRWPFDVTTRILERGWRRAEIHFTAVGDDTLDTQWGFDDIEVTVCTK